MKKVHRSRLRKLANYLDSKVLQENFDMEEYCRQGEVGVPIEDAKESLKACGSAACAIGHAANLFPRIAKRCSGYGYFSEECFDLIEFHETWNFLFSSEWTPNQNTPQEAAERIRLFLDRGLPAGWDYWMPINEWVWK